MELARRLAEDKPDGVNVKLLATGAEEAGFFGITAYNRLLKRQSGRRPFFINIDSVGGGKLTWGIAEESLARIDYPTEGIDVLNQMEAAAILPKLPKTCIIAPTDSSQIATSGFPVLTMIGLKDNAIPPNYHKRSDTFDRLDIQNLSTVSDIVETFIRNFPGNAG